MLANRSERLLEYCLAHKDFLVGGTYCLQRLYDDVIMFKGVYTGLKDESAASRSVATSEQKLWSIGHLVDMLLVPSWENPGLLDQMLAAKTVDDVVEGARRPRYCAPLGGVPLSCFGGRGPLWPLRGERERGCPASGATAV